MRETLINNFKRISKIPRESGHEEKIADFFINVAKEKKLYYFKDENNNVLIRKRGNINSEPVALHAHLDMVCVKKEDSHHDFSREGIEVIIKGDNVIAIDTSLGADQGVGLAMMLAIMEDDTLKHPDLEFMFTTEEETTFNGSVTFPYGKVESKRLINLDNAQDDSIVIGADGDILNEYTMEGKLIECDLPSYRILIDNFPGGNSGDNIELSENNAIAVMAKALKDKDIVLRSINGGIFENDLAANCEVIVNTNLDLMDIFSDLDVEIEKWDNKLVFSKEDTENIVREVLDLKSGYLIQNNASANLGVIKTEDNIVKISYIIRSSDEIELEEISKKSKMLNNNFMVREIYRDSIWKDDRNSILFNKYKKLYFEEFNEYPEDKIAHGGLECTSIKKRMKNLDIISIGANIEKFHTVEEITYISSWLKIYRLLVKFLEII